MFQCRNGEVEVYLVDGDEVLWCDEDGPDKMNLAEFVDRFGPLHETEESAYTEWEDAHHRRMANRLDRG